MLVVATVVDLSVCESSEAQWGDMMGYGATYCEEWRETFI